jgi:hypothetical protein
MLTKAEQLELEMLEAEEMKTKQNQLGLNQVKVPHQLNPNLTHEEARELALLEEEEKLALQRSQPQQLDLEVPEADLGFATRAKYAIEPLESNRRALLIKEFGAENVLQDEKGNVFLKQGKYFRPVNREGFSTADIAEVGGTLPELIGTGAGLGAGPIGAVAGGALGSVARQGLSTLLGTPQVASGKEQALEIGLSGAMGGLGFGVGKLAKGAGKALSNLLPEQQVDDAFKAISGKVGVKPTKGQLVGGRALEIEKTLQETPIFGRGIRKQTTEQVKQLKNNLSDSFGDFTDLDFDKTTIGAELKNRAGANLDAIKSQAVNLFDEVASQGDKINVSSNNLIDSFSKNLSDLNIIDKLGNPKKYNAFSGLTKDQFNKVQGVTLDLISAIKNTAKLKGGVINANEVNTLRKTIDAEIREAGKMGLDDVALLKMREAFLDLTENMLGTQDKKILGSGSNLKNQFKEARSLYKNYLQNKNVLEKDFKLLGQKSLSDEKVIDRIFRDSKSLDTFINLTDEKTAKLAGDNYIRNLLSSKIGRDGQFATKTAIKTIYEKGNQIKKAIGKDGYDNLITNLKYLDRIGEPINPSKTAITELRTNLMKGAFLKGEQIARNKLIPATKKVLESNIPFRSASQATGDIMFRDLFRGDQ